MHANEKRTRRILPYYSLCFCVNTGQIGCYTTPRAWKKYSFNMPYNNCVCTKLRLLFSIFFKHLFYFFGTSSDYGRIYLCFGPPLVCVFSTAVFLNRVSKHYSCITYTDGSLKKNKEKKKEMIFSCIFFRISFFFFVSFYVTRAVDPLLC
jgi:hypothetical protein